MLLIILSLIPSINAQIPEPRDPAECPDFDIPDQDTQCEREQRESSKEIKFVNAYFGSIENNIDKVEVAPNDGITNLVVILANNGHFELAGFRGWLTLPNGLEAVDGSSRAFDTYDLNIKSGDLIYLEFPVKVKNAKIGWYNAPLYVEYFRVRDQGLHFRDMDIQFRLTGKSIIDAYASEPRLSIGNNQVEINILNKGSAMISAATANLESNTLAIKDGKTLPLGTIEPNQIVKINPSIYVNPNLANSIQTLKIDIEYYDSYGEKKSKELSIEFMVEGSTNNIDLGIDSNKSIIQVLKDEELIIKIKNDGYEEARNVEVLISNPTTQGVKPELSIIGDGYFLIDSIKPDEEKEITLRLFATESASGDVFELPISISYIDANGGKYDINRKISLYAQGIISLRIYDVSISMIGNIPNLSGFLLNEGTDTALFTTVELVDGVGSQYIGDLDPNSPTPFAIPLENREISEAQIRVVYKDDLRNSHEVILASSVNFTPIQQEVGEEKESPRVNQTFMYIIAAIGGIAAISIYIMRKRRQEQLEI
ncbi:MAG: hypothetical protein KatS3mg003_2270 [Candidatus Nitrosocaldaceae archaeon]|nr:MAG: hypothetical protein KatS3mg003_2270 [Candidatus Nitrosocaldaceae archaeon]